MNTDITIRKASIHDLEEIAALEAICFPAAEAASKESFAWRLQTYPDHFIVLLIDGKIVSFVNGPVTVGRDLIDEMYDNPAYSDENGNWQMIFGLVTHPDYQRQGLAAMVMNRLIGEARAQLRSGVVLTCKTSKIAYYERFGYVDEGLSVSTHGGVPWHQMRLTF